MERVPFDFCQRVGQRCPTGKRLFNDPKWTSAFSATVDYSIFAVLLYEDRKWRYLFCEVTLKNRDDGSLEFITGEYSLEEMKNEIAHLRYLLEDFTIIDNSNRMLMCASEDTYPLETSLDSFLNFICFLSKGAQLTVSLENPLESCDERTLFEGFAKMTLSSIIIRDYQQSFDDSIRSILTSQYTKLFQFEAEGWSEANITTLSSLIATGELRNVAIQKNAPFLFDHVEAILQNVLDNPLDFERRPLNVSITFQAAIFERLPGFQNDLRIKFVPNKEDEPQYRWISEGVTVVVEKYTDSLGDKQLRITTRTDANSSQWEEVYFG